MGAIYKPRHAAKANQLKPAQNAPDEDHDDDDEIDNGYV